MLAPARRHLLQRRANRTCYLAKVDLVRRISSSNPILHDPYRVAVGRVDTEGGSAGPKHSMCLHVLLYHLNSQRKTVRDCFNRIAFTGVKLGADSQGIPSERVSQFGAQTQRVDLFSKASSSHVLWTTRRTVTLQQEVCDPEPP